MSHCSCEKDETFKVSRFTLSDIKSVSAPLIKEASSKNGNGNYDDILKAEITKNPNALFFRAKAIEANVPNNNGDYFSEEELKKSAQTFVGVPFFTNHQNQDIEKAKGKIVFAEWNDKEKAIYVIAFVDRDAYPHLARGIEKEYVNGVSMGCAVEYSICSICRKRASSQDEYCPHVRNMKGRKFSGQATDVITGETKTFKNASVYEDNYGIRFIELSGVVDPACPSCQIAERYSNDKFQKAASSLMDSVNAISMFKSSGRFEKEASQQDVDNLNGALKTLQDIAIKLIQNRQSIEVTFSSDLVKILADLQEYVDGLIEAGFAKLPDNAPSAGGQPEMNQNGPANALPPPQQANQPVSATEDMGAGSVSGNVEAPLTQEPNAPMAPQPDLESFKDATRPSASATQKNTKLQVPISPRKSQSGDNEMRRIPSVSGDQKRKISNVLQSNWQEKLEKLSNTLKESLAEDLIKTNNNCGGIEMSNIHQEAGKSDTGVTTENQLDGGIKYHPRQGDPENETSELQLDPERTKKVGDKVVEGLLDREDKVKNEVEETLLAGERKGSVKDEVLNKQLEPNRTGKEVDGPIEKVLAKSATSIKDHVEAALDIVSKVVVVAQSTPDRVLKVAGSFASLSLSEQMAFVKSLSQSQVGVSVENFKERVAFWSNKGLQVTAATDKDIKSFLSAYASSGIKDGGLQAETLVRAFGVLKNNSKSASIVSDRVTEIMKSASNVETVDTEAAMNGVIEGLSETQEKASCKCGKSSCDCEKESPSAEKVSKETKDIEEKLAKASSEHSDIIIETSLSEMGLTREASENDETLRVSVEAFARGACSNLGIKTAAVVNVTVDGDSGDVVIAVDTQEGSVEIPVGGGKKEEEDMDLGKDETADKAIGQDVGSAPSASAVPSTPTAPSTPAAGTTSPSLDATNQNAPSGGIGAFTSTKKDIKVAQFGGGSPSGTGGAQDPVGGAPQKGQELSGMPSAAPGEGAGLSSFTQGEDANAEELPGDSEKKKPGQTCPFCGSEETKTGNKDQAPGQFDCTSCGAKYLFEVVVEMLNPETIVNGDEDKVSDEEMKEPKSPAMPIAASVSLNRDSLKKMAKIQKDVGHVCPACGTGNVVANGNLNDVKISCNKCGTEAEKSVLINVENPTESELRVAWTLDPMKSPCSPCREKATKLAAERVFGKMIALASKVQVPESKVRAWLSANYPGSEVVTNGPFKGMNLAETIIGQLKRFGFSKVKYLKRLAEVQTMEDPMDTCVKDRKKGGYTIAESLRMCDCDKRKFETEEDSNIYMQAFASDINVHILRKMAATDLSNAQVVKVAETKKEEVDENADLSALPEAPKNEKKDNSKKATKEISDNLKKDVVSLFEGEKAAKSSKSVKASSEEVHVKTEGNKEKEVKIEGVSSEKNEKPNLSRSKIGEENTDKMDEPKVPRGDATMGEETKAPEEGVKVPSKEGEVTALGKEAGAKEKELEQVDSIVETEGADVPSQGKKSTIGEEQAPATDKPEVPRGDATMGNEEKFDAESPKIPVENSETNTQFTGVSNVEAARRHQMEKIASARREFAMRYAGQFIERGLVKEEELEKFVTDLSSLPLDRMKSHVDVMMRSASAKTEVKKQASVTLATPIVNEASVLEVKPEVSLKDKLADAFTIGGIKYNKAIRQAINEDKGY